MAGQITHVGQITIAHIHTGHIIHAGRDTHTGQVTHVGQIRHACQIKEFDVLGQTHMQVKSHRRAKSTRRIYVQSKSHIHANSHIWAKSHIWANSHIQANSCSSCAWRVFRFVRQEKGLILLPARMRLGKVFFRTTPGVHLANGDAPGDRIGDGTWRTRRVFQAKMFPGQHRAKVRPIPCKLHGSTHMQAKSHR